MTKNGIVFRTRRRNRHAELVVRERPTDDYADEYGDDPAGEETKTKFYI
jgi:hypothetical protein